jgi:hypothetical protein
MSLKKKVEKRHVKDRRDESSERRVKERRKAERRAGTRRKEFCPNCGTLLTALNYCSRCKVRVIKIR